MKRNFKNELSAVTPIDGRYKRKTQELSAYLSEYALIKHRVEIEIRYLIFLSRYKFIRKLSKNEISLLEGIYLDFSQKDAEKIKILEEKTKHDIKAIEKFLILKFNQHKLSDLNEFIHIFLTSEDINNLAYRIMIKKSLNEILLKLLWEIQSKLFTISTKNKNIAMLARTHGQAAVPTTFGKEIYVFYKRLENEYRLLSNSILKGKLNGAVGNYNSFYFVYPGFNWINFSKIFIKSLELKPNIVTTQINPYEDIIFILQNLHRINGILLDFNQDVWRYISDGYLKLAVNEGEIGSSTMPQKVNPIDFENSEGNLILANDMIQSMINKLYVSRLQRDLSNSTVIRNIGTSFAYCLLAYKSLLSGLLRIDINKLKMGEDLYKDWGILAEGVQTYLRSKKFIHSYDQVAKLTKGKVFCENEFKQLIYSLKIPESDKQKLLTLSPENYKGISNKLVGIK